MSDARKNLESAQLLVQSFFSAFIAGVQQDELDGNFSHSVNALLHRDREQFDAGWCARGNADKMEILSLGPTDQYPVLHRIVKKISQLTPLAGNTKEMGYAKEENK